MVFSQEEKHWKTRQKPQQHKKVLTAGTKGEMITLARVQCPVLLRRSCVFTIAAQRRVAVDDFRSWRVRRSS